MIFLVLGFYNGLYLQFSTRKVLGNNVIFKFFTLKSLITAVVGDLQRDVTIAILMLIYRATGQIFLFIMLVFCFISFFSSTLKQVEVYKR